MAGNDEIKKCVEEYLDKHEMDSEELAEAIYQAMLACAEWAKKRATPGEVESIELLVKASIENTIRANNYKRGTTQTMDPNDPVVAARSERYKA